ncbi:MAG: Nif3-like dinuclear metal center hexameric protein, partial [Desulfobacteraceae bacterium]|nr:Nif3-like dinuclear metal center hexameric protein [Desulfobacteraceae bacterium]
LITHHPLIFKPLKTINVSSPTGAIIERAARDRLAVFAAHTNLDSAGDGVNDVLCEKIGVKPLAPLCPARAETQYKLVFFVPESHTAAMIQAVCQSPAGVIGNYSCCTFRSPGRGTFMPGPGADPYDGTPGQLSEVPEVRMETNVAGTDLRQVIGHIQAHHPYETMAYDVYPVDAPPSSHGLGRFASIDPPRDLSALAGDMKEALGLDSVRFSGPGDMEIHRAAVCSGGGGGVISDFLASDAQVLISGDLRYHDAVNICEAGRAMIDIGHFASERLVVPVLAQRLEAACQKAGADVRVTAWQGETDPFNYL